MDIFWSILAGLFMLGGILGCILPLLPGPPLSFVALLILQLKSEPPFTTGFIFLWLAVAVVVTALDYVVPLYGTKKFGGSKYGVWGSTIGLVVGIFAGPWGIILGPFVGALIGELIANQNSEQAMRAALGSFIGFLFGTLMKLVTCLVMAWYFVTALW